MDRAAETTAKIIAAATEVFSEAGFSGARVDEIAARSGVNKATIYYHIGNKKVLYGEVMHNVMGNLAMHLARDVKEAQTPEQRLKAYVRNFVATINLNPHLPPIIMRELASGGKNLPEVATKDMNAVVGILASILEDGATRGDFAVMSPFIVHAMILGAIILFKVSSPIRARIEVLPEELKGDRISPEVAAELERLALKMVREERQKD
ncbi:MAG: TetR/AcrR family transcriptional regulator [Smithellaceae bacterium]|nr:TetR/AcrR family transcriptional regulator [Smithellaceae bacterium]